MTERFAPCTTTRTPGRARFINNKPILILDQTFSSLDCGDPSSSPTSQALPVFATVLPNVEISLQVCNHIRRIVVEDVVWEHERKLQQTTQQALEKRFEGHFLLAIPKQEGGLKKVFYRLIEPGFTDVAEQETLCDKFDCSIERLTQALMFIEAFAAHTLSISSRFTRPDASFVPTCMDETANEWCIKAKSKGF